jgi:hypothetical protein
MYLLVYVDDIIDISSSMSTADCLVTALSSYFAVKDLSKLHYFLGLKVTYCDAVLTLIQQKRVDLVFTLVHTHPLNAIGYAFRWRNPASLY